MIKILELFGGIGACSKALERLNIEHEVVDYVEIDITTKEILEIYDIKSFPALVSWSTKKTKLAVGKDEILYYLTYSKDSRR